jgi:hypothetical protein
MNKTAVSAVAGLFMTLAFVWQAEAFFSRDQWFFPTNNGGTVTQSLTTHDVWSTLHNGTNGSNGSNGYTGHNESNGTNGTIITNIANERPSTSVVPEPSTVLLLATGMMGLGLWRLKQRRGEI